MRRFRRMFRRKGITLVCDDVGVGVLLPRIGGGEELVYLVRHYPERLKKSEQADLYDRRYRGYRSVNQ